jgi:quercetin dioxygenase-like cupin family protein
VIAARRRTSGSGARAGLVARALAVFALLGLCVFVGPASPTRAAADELAPEDPQLHAISVGLEAAQAKIHRCWEQAAADDFRLGGKLVLRITFGGGGKAKAVQVLTDEPKDPVLTACVVALAKTFNWGAAFRDGDGVELPFAFVAPAAQYTVREVDSPVRAPAGGKLEAKILIDRESAAAKDASLTALSLKADTEIPLHVTQSAKVIVVLSGAVRVKGLGKALGGGKGEALDTGDAAYVPAGVASAIVSTCCKKGPTRLLVLYAPGGPERPFKDPQAAATAGISAVPKAATKNVPKDTPQPKVARAKSVAELTVAAGKGHVKILFDKDLAQDGAAYVGHVRFDPGVNIPEHVHAGEAELLYITSGSGEMTVAGETFTVEAGMAVYIPPGTKHAATSKTGLVAVQFYTPSGPEQRFKAAPQAAPPAAPAASEQ